jgi:hypothetical protein
MSKTDAWETGLLNLLFRNIDFAGVGDAGGLRGSVVAGSLYLSLHTADPGDAGNQTTNETAYYPYARRAVTRGAGFTVNGNAVSPAADINFPECLSSPGETITHVGIGTALNGAGKLLYVGILKPNVPMAVGAVPLVKSASTVTES